MKRKVLSRQGVGYGEVRERDRCWRGHSSLVAGPVVSPSIVVGRESLAAVIMPWFCPTVQVLGRTIIRAWSHRETKTFDSSSAFRTRFHTTHRNRTQMETVDAVRHRSVGAGMQREDVTDQNESDRSKLECVRCSPNGLCQRQVSEKYPAPVVMLGSPNPVRPTRKSEINVIHEAT